MPPSTLGTVIRDPEWCPEHRGLWEDDPGHCLWINWGRRKQTPMRSSLRCGLSLPTPSAAWHFFFLSLSFFPKVGFQNSWSCCAHPPVTCSCSQHTMPPLCGSVAVLRPNPSILCTGSQASLASQTGRTGRGWGVRFTPSTALQRWHVLLYWHIYFGFPNTVVKLCLLYPLATWEIVSVPVQVGLLVPSDKCPAPFPGSGGTVVTIVQPALLTASRLFPHCRDT